MSHKFEKLVDLISVIENSLDRGEWEEIAKCDLSVKAIVSDYSSSTLDVNDKSRLIDLLVKLNTLYDRLGAENLGRRTELGGELKKLNKERNAISQYIQSSGY